METAELAHASLMKQIAVLDKMDADIKKLKLDIPSMRAPMREIKQGDTLGVSVKSSTGQEFSETEMDTMMSVVAATVPRNAIIDSKVICLDSEGFVDFQVAIFANSDLALYHV